MSKVKIGISRLSAVELVAYAQGIHDSLDGNANFPTPTPTLEVLQTSIDALASANAAVDANGGRLEHQNRRDAERTLRFNMNTLGNYVQMTSGGDEEQIVSSGFPVAKRPSPIGELAPPKNLGARLTNMSGRVELNWDVEYGADLYHVFMSTSNDPFNWELVGATTKSRFNADSLEPGTFYWFSVTAIGAAGETSKSDVLLAMAAA